MDIVRLVQKFFLYGDREAIKWQDQTIDYRTLFNHILKLASGFHYFGLKPGEFLAIYLDNSPDFIYAFYAGFLNGVTVLPISDCLGQDEIKRIIYTTGCKHMLTTPHLFAKIKENPFFDEALENVILIDEDRNSLSWSNEMIGSNKELVLTNYTYHFDNLSGALMYFTSGSTGKPKGVLHNYEFILKVGTFYERNFGYSQADKIFITMTLGYVVGSVMQVMSGLYVGATLVLDKNFEPERMLEAIVNDDITSAFITPCQLSDLLTLAKHGHYSSNSIRAFYSGGNSVSIELIERFHEIFNKPVTQVWGMTECLNAMKNDNVLPDKRGALGKPFPETHVVIINSRGEEVDIGEVGELCVKTPMIFQGYYKDEETTEKSMLCGFLKTGDLVYRDVDDYIWFKGRKKHIIVCGASNVSPEEVEQALAEYCGLSKTCVFGKRDVRKGEVPVVVLEEKEQSIQLEEVQKSLEGKIADYKVPCELYYVPQFPTLSSGKIDIKKIKEMLFRR